MTSNQKCPFGVSTTRSSTVESEYKIGVLFNLYNFINYLGYRFLGPFWFMQYIFPLYPGIIRHHYNLTSIRNFIIGHKNTLKSHTIDEGRDSSSYFVQSGIYSIASNNNGVCSFRLGFKPALYFSKNFPLTDDKNLSPSTAKNSGLFGDFMGTYDVSNKLRNVKRQPINSTLGSSKFCISKISYIENFAREYLNVNINRNLDLENFCIGLVSYIDSLIPGIVDFKERPINSFLEDDKYGEIVRNFFNIASDIISKLDDDGFNKASDISNFVKELILSNFHSISSAEDSNIIKKYFKINDLEFTKDIINDLNDDFLKELGTIIIALYDTTSLSLLWAITYIESDKNLKNEVIKNSRLKYEAHKINFLDLVVLETIRLGGSNPTALWRESIKPFTLKIKDTDLYIRKGTMIWLDRLSSNKDPDVFPFPNEFNIQNIISIIDNEDSIQNILSSSRYEINSFSMVNTTNNPRKCPGRIFSVYVQSILLKLIYSEYLIKTKIISQNLRLDSSMPKPEAGSQILIKALI